MILTSLTDTRFVLVAMDKFNPNEPRDADGKWTSGDGVSSVTAINEVDAEHLKIVVAEMKAAGAPTIRVINTGKGHAAVEGSHRLAAAKKLKISPNFEVLDLSKEYHSSDFPRDFSEEFYSSRHFNDGRDDNNGITDFKMTGEEIARYVAENTGKKYRVYAR